MNLQSQILNLTSTYAWGLDLSGSEQGAGGVGGLLFVSQQSQTTANNSQPSQTALLAPSYDGNGNITAYINIATGQVISRHEYDAFGNELSIDSNLVSGSLGSGVSSLPAFKFSTKYTDAETGLCYYGYRYYSPDMGRWLNRDPIRNVQPQDITSCVYSRQLIRPFVRFEAGEAFVGNNPVSKADYLGLDECLDRVDRTWRAQLKLCLEELNKGEIDSTEYHQCNACANYCHNRGLGRCKNDDAGYCVDGAGNLPRIPGRFDGIASTDVHPSYEQFFGDCRCSNTDSQ